MKRIVIELFDIDDEIFAKYQFDDPDQYKAKRTQLTSQSLESTRQIIEITDKQRKKKTEYNDVVFFLGAVKQAVEDILNRSPSP